MANLIYSAITSLDGYIEDNQGGIEWSAPDDEVHSFINDLERPIGVYLYGRRMYETMVYWETAGTSTELSPVSREFAHIWRAAEKIVYSRTLRGATSERTRIEPELDFDAIRRLKETSESDISVGGAELAGQVMAAGLVDEIHLFIAPTIIGGGKRALLSNVRSSLCLVGEHRFQSGVVYVHYRFGT